MSEKKLNFQYAKEIQTYAEDFLSSCLGFQDFGELTILPGFCDVHVHFREPGFSYKETIRSGSYAAARGGYTDVCTMPNLNPVPDSADHLKEECDIIKRDAVIGVHPYGAVTVGEQGKELADLDAMAKNAVAFSDDGHGVQDEEMMRLAMEKAKKLKKIICAHCEDNTLLFGGYIHDGAYAKDHGHRGISSESEWKAIERDVRLVRETGASYHVCHISTKESVDIIRRAKKEGLDITCETAPHYLLLDESDLEEDGCFKMNPPLRSAEDRLALLSGIADGTIDMLATDHAPHAASEKAGGLEKSAFGIVGIETAFPLLYTFLVKQGVISMEKLLDLLVYNPRKRFCIPLKNSFSVWNLNASYPIDSALFLSKGKATPFEKTPVFGENLLTVFDGHAVFQKPANNPRMYHFQSLTGAHMLNPYNKKLILQNGDEYYGYAFGSHSDRVLEIVFNTSVVGYQEILSDPSYTDQGVVMTYPLIGNYGMAEDDYETLVPTIGALIVREYNPAPSSWRCAGTLEEVMQKYDVTGISGIDTRKLTRSIRDTGSMPGLLTSAETPLDEGLRILSSCELPRDAVSRVSRKETQRYYSNGALYHVVAVDCGMKENIVRSLFNRDCNVTVVPWNTSFETIESLEPDGVFLSNGPGDPADVTLVIETVKRLIGKVPIFGICLGHQILSLAYGAKTYKLKFGHRGGNHPVKNLLSGKIEITSQNHSYAVDEESLKNTRLCVTHRNLLDNTVEGVRCESDRAFGVQYHPESAPGPQDSAYLFDEFISLMEDFKNAKKN